MDVNVVITGKNLGCIGKYIYCNCLCLTWDSPTVSMLCTKTCLPMQNTIPVLQYSIMWCYFDKLGIFCPRFIQQVIGLFWILSSNQELEKKKKYKYFLQSNLWKWKHAWSSLSTHSTTVLYIVYKCIWYW